MGWLKKVGMAACLVAVMGFASACKQSAEDVERSWNTAEQDAQKYASKYPVAKPAIDELLKTAKAEFDEAKKADEKTRADKMKVSVDKVASANKIFADYEAEVTKLETLANDSDFKKSLNGEEYEQLLGPKSGATTSRKKACCLLQPDAKSCSDLSGTCDKGATVANFGDLKAKLEPAVTEIKAATKALEAKKPAKPSGGSTSSPGGTSSPNSTSSPAGTSKP